MVFQKISMLRRARRENSRSKPYRPPMPAGGLPFTERTLGFRSGGFTLIELLIVILIIVALAVLIIPVAQNVMRASLSAACTSNLRRVGIAVLGYAADNNGWSPLINVNTNAAGIAPPANSGQGWVTVLIVGGYLPPFCPGQHHPAICPAWTPKVFPTNPKLASWDQGYTYGMRSPLDRSLTTWGFRLMGGNVIDGGRNQTTGAWTSGKVDFGSPSHFLFIADTVFTSPLASPQPTNPQRGMFVTYQQGPNDIHLRHLNRGNFLFGDGHVESLGMTNLVGNYGGLNDGSNNIINSFMITNSP